MMRLLAVILTPLLLSACVNTPQQAATVQPAAKVTDQEPKPQKTVQRKRTSVSTGTGGTGAGGTGTGGEADSWGGS